MFLRTKFPYTMVEIWRRFCWYGLQTTQKKVNPCIEITLIFTADTRFLRAITW